MERIAVLDFGSQYAHLIAKRLRLLGYYAEIASPASDAESLRSARGIVLSGGPSSVFAADAPEFNRGIMALPVPVLGLCYGHQLMAEHYGGRVGRGAEGEFGIARLEAASGGGGDNPLLADVAFPAQVWMSHQDTVAAPPEGFRVSAFTEGCPYAALHCPERRRFSFQFHVEVKDTPCGGAILASFARYCGMSRNWEQDAVADSLLRRIQAEAAGKRVLLFLSGGVDSTVAFALLNKALGAERVLGLHIDNGFMRKNESAAVAERYRTAGFSNFIVEDASERFLAAVAGRTDPQEKRKAVGEAFVAVRDEVVSRMSLDESEWLLAQGTLYPDIIESGGTKNARTIKTHHNRVAGIQALIDQGLVIEPLKELYKDEVRAVGLKLGLPRGLVMRHPFPGPGLSINVLCSRGDFDRAGFDRARSALAAFRAERLFPPEYRPCFSAEVLPVKSVGVQGDFRTYRFPVALAFRRGEGEALAAPDWETLERASSALTNGIPDVNRAVLRLFSHGELRLREGYCDRARLDQTREADAIALEELKRSGWYDAVFQHLTVNLPYAASDGHCALVLRPVVSEDVMTARFARLDRNVLWVIARRIAALGFVDALYYDITNKPPATFGWE